MKQVGERYKMPGLTSILSLFRIEFNNLNNTGAWMLEYIYHMMKSNFWRKKLYKFVILYATMLWTS